NLTASYFHPAILTKIFRRPSIALVLWAEFPVSMLLIIQFPRDDVDGKPAASQMIERGDLARKQSRSNKTRSVRHEIAKPLRLHRRIKGDQKSFRRRR